MVIRRNSLQVFFYLRQQIVKHEEKNIVITIRIKEKEIITGKNDAQCVFSVQKQRHKVRKSTANHNEVLLNFECDAIELENVIRIMKKELANVVKLKIMATASISIHQNPM